MFANGEQDPKSVVDTTDGAGNEDVAHAVADPDGAKNNDAKAILAPVRQNADEYEVLSEHDDALKHKVLIA